MSGGSVLVLNAGSSSLKACVFDSQGACLWRDQRPWHAERSVGAHQVDAHQVGAPQIGALQADALQIGAYQVGAYQVGAHQAGDVQEADGALEAVLADWLPSALEPWLDQLGLVGHRIVHGGERFVAPTRLTASVLAELDALLPLAPLHNGPALRAIRWLSERWPQLEPWGCFDTAFHAHLPEAAHTYALPQAWRANGQRRYGFHGLNHQHISAVVAAQPWAPACRPLRLISCHLGAGCSVAAILDGRSIATTMGFTPLEGVVMASRSGSVDPGLLLHLLRHNVSA
ncbi:MAG: hypothetical protein ACK5N0_15025, partial [Synechococcaceae cyanobacterium]